MQKYINLAVAKGRLADTAVKALEGMEICFNDYSSNSRKLIHMDQKKRVRLVLVKADDVPTYVEQGAADIGIVGKDTLLESMASVYEMMDLEFGKCKFVVAALKDYVENVQRKTYVATKYVYVAKEFFKRKGKSVEIIKLNGSVELAPIMGLADMIVDIVETGTTLRENGLVIVEEICPVSARLIVNKASLKTKGDIIETMIQQLRPNQKREEV
ncbi:ATP phosphoribosyltransferase [Anaerosolibacter carboniphilus]|uniref:ATP phosphoribosyltransferase n=1 Tax=Anaerosolibacter carboniphilus TaxID=1417629 RepID=A0A841KQB3_9FIRM|nr:ATP phosphoribosyltransferase [Anaerosolibacter carboniphilus]MBB6215676.1 ATP phosphoribosyltransferase [Anaerosolibacter carboniphilus]